MKKNIYGENSLDYGLSLVRIAMLYDVTQRFSEALDCIKQNQSLKNWKTQTDSYAKTLEGIASNLMRMGQFKEAENIFFKELELYENNISLKKI
ncbi:MAG: tetratricopeptide repeat protein [Saprospiraceae bacterium]|nr:tetratricopeptide repeat protein [Saprospiraceae bacterium]